VHVSNIMRKLGVTSRLQAATAAHSHLTRTLELPCCRLFMPKAGSAPAGTGHIDQICAQPLPSFDEPPAVRIGGGVRIIWVEGLITKRNDADGLAAGCDEIPPIPGV
jgi:hypothetical protein